MLMATNLPFVSSRRFFQFGPPFVKSVSSDPDPDPPTLYTPHPWVK